MPVEEKEQKEQKIAGPQDEQMEADDDDDDDELRGCEEEHDHEDYDSDDSDLIFRRADIPEYSQHLIDLREGVPVIDLLEEQQRENQEENRHDPRCERPAPGEYSWAEEHDEYPTDDEIEITVDAVRALNAKYRRCKRALIAEQLKCYRKSWTCSNRFFRHNALLRAIRKHSQ